MQYVFGRFEVAALLQLPHLGKCLLYTSLRGPFSSAKLAARAGKLKRRTSASTFTYGVMRTGHLLNELHCFVRRTCTNLLRKFLVKGDWRLRSAHLAGTLLTADSGAIARYTKCNICTGKAFQPISSEPQPQRCDASHRHPARCIDPAG